MHIANIFTRKKPVLSLEVFPPQPTSPIEVLDETLSQLSSLAPDYISVTYGAGGSSVASSQSMAQRVAQDCHCPVLGHLTCVGASPTAIDHVLDGFADVGIQDVLALRGDIPKDMDKEKAFEHFCYANQLVDHIVQRGGFSIAAACYPEAHFESDSAQQDLDMLKQKVDSGVDFLVTQMFFDNCDFFEFYENARNAGIAVPITAGVMPIRDASQILRMTTLCGASIPLSLSRIIARYGDSPDDFSKAAFDFACRQLRGLLDYGIDGIHLYTMNRPKLIQKLLDAVL